VLVYGDISIYYLEPSSVPEILGEFIKIRAVPLVFFKEFPVLLLFRVEGSEHSLFYSKELNIYLAMSDLTGEEEVLLKKGGFKQADSLSLEMPPLSEREF